MMDNLYEPHWLCCHSVESKDGRLEKLQKEAMGIIGLKIARFARLKDLIRRGITPQQILDDPLQECSSLQRPDCFYQGFPGILDARGKRFL